MICTAYQILLGGSIEENEACGPRGTCGGGGREMHTGNLKGRPNLEGPYVFGRIVLELIRKK
jgi:hypothetical protein